MFTALTVAQLVSFIEQSWPAERMRPLPYADKMACKRLCAGFTRLQAPHDIPFMIAYNR